MTDLSASGGSADVTARARASPTSARSSTRCSAQLQELQGRLEVASTDAQQALEEARAARPLTRGAGAPGGAVAGDAPRWAPGAEGARQTGVAGDAGLPRRRVRRVARRERGRLY